MKPFYKIGIAAAIAFAAYASYFFIDWSNSEDVSKEQVEEKSSTDTSIIDLDYYLGTEPTYSVDFADEAMKQRETRIREVISKAEARYLEIVKISGASGEELMAYEDNWCLASEDLSEQDQAYAATQLQEWELSRGKIMFRGGSANALMQGLGPSTDEFPGVNDEYLDTYREADDETLLRLSKQDDMLALATILDYDNNGRFDEQTELEAAKQLVVLGDTHSGLRHLVLQSISRAREAKLKGNGDPKAHLKSALALIEFGMMRQDVSNLRIFLSNAADYETRLEGINPEELLTEEDFTDVKRMALKYREEINQERIQKGLRSFDEIDESKVAQIQYAERLSSYFDEYASLMESNVLPTHWKSTYLKRTPCVERRIARHSFLMNELPAIRDEIATLEQSLN